MGKNVLLVDNDKESEECICFQMKFGMNWHYKVSHIPRSYVYRLMLKDTLAIKA